MNWKTLNHINGSGNMTEIWILLFFLLKNNNYANFPQSIYIILGKLYQYLTLWGLTDWDDGSIRSDLFSKAEKSPNAAISLKATSVFCLLMRRLLSKQKEFVHYLFTFYQNNCLNSLLFKKVYLHKYLLFVWLKIKPLWKLWSSQFIQNHIY